MSLEHKYFHPEFSSAALCVFHTIRVADHRNPISCERSATRQNYSSGFIFIVRASEQARNIGFQVAIDRLACVLHAQPFPFPLSVCLTFLLNPSLICVCYSWCLIKSVFHWSHYCKCPLIFSFPLLGVFLSPKHIFLKTCDQMEWPVTRYWYVQCCQV